MSQDPKCESVQDLLEKAGIRHDQVEPLSQQLLRLLQSVDHETDRDQHYCEAVLRFELERSWGG